MHCTVFAITPPHTHPTLFTHTYTYTHTECVGGLKEGAGERCEEVSEDMDQCPRYSYRGQGVK